MRKTLLIFVILGLICVSSVFAESESEETSSSEDSETSEAESDSNASDSTNDEDLESESSTEKDENASTDDSSESESSDDETDEDSDEMPKTVGDMDDEQDNWWGRRRRRRRRRRTPPKKEPTSPPPPRSVRCEETICLKRGEVCSPRGGGCRQTCIERDRTHIMKCTKYYTTPADRCTNHPRGGRVCPRYCVKCEKVKKPAPTAPSDTHRRFRDDDQE